MKVILTQIDSDSPTIVPGLKQAIGLPVFFNASGILGDAILASGRDVRDLGSRLSPDHIDSLVGNEIEVSPGFGRISDVVVTPKREVELFQHSARRFSYRLSGPVVDVLMTEEVEVCACGFKFLIDSIRSEQLPKEDQWITFLVHGLSLWV